MHKITSYCSDKRKILNQKFWSQGTPLGSMGPGSPKALPQIFSQNQFLVILGPYNNPALVACHGQAENLNLNSITVWRIFGKTNATSTL